MKPGKTSTESQESSDAEPAAGNARLVRPVQTPDQGGQWWKANESIEFDVNDRVSQGVVRGVPMNHSLRKQRN